MNQWKDWVDFRWICISILEEENKRGKKSLLISEGHTALYTYIPFFFSLLGANFPYPIVLNMSFT